MSAAEVPAAPLRWQSSWVVAIAVFATITILLSCAGLLPGGAALRSVAFQLPEFGLLTLAMAISLLAGGINLAVVSTANLSAILAIQSFHLLAGTVLGSSLPLVIGLLTGSGAGLLIGLVITRLRVTPVIATLSAMLIYSGIGIVLTHGSAVTGLPEFLPRFAASTLLGVPVILILFLLVAGLSAIGLGRTAFGFRLRATGLNGLAAQFSGVDTARVQITVYVLSGLLSGAAGLVMLARFNSARMGYADSYLLVTLLAAVLGGVSPAGGKGTLSSLLIAMIVLQGVATALNLAGVDQYASGIAWGGILIGKLGYDRCRLSVSRWWRVREYSKTVSEEVQGHHD